MYLPFHFQLKSKVGPNPEQRQTRFGQAKETAGLQRNGPQRIDRVCVGLRCTLIFRTTCLYF